MRAGRAPHLVGVASAVTYLPMPRAEAYGASKAGLRYLFESLRISLSPENIDVTVISPGFVDTPLTERNDFPMPLAWSADKAARHIFAKLDKRPLEIAFPAMFIATLWPLSKLPNRAQLIIGNACCAARHRKRTTCEDRDYRQRHCRADQRLPAQPSPRHHPVRSGRSHRRAYPHGQRHRRG